MHANDRSGSGGSGSEGSDAEDTPPGGRPIGLRQYFSGLAEYAFETRLGVADPPLVDYLAELLARFIRADAVFALKDLAGRRLAQVADMVVEADARQGEAKRKAHRQIGDFTLFWTGVYPEALPRMRAARLPDQFVDYCSQGKRAYHIASTIPAPADDADSSLLERLSHDFEMCVFGLGEVRRAWEGDNGPASVLWVQ